MVSKKTVSGKHPLTVRVSHEGYELIKRAAYRKDMTPTEYIACVAVECARKDLEG